MSSERKAPMPVGTSARELLRRSKWQERSGLVDSAILHRIIIPALLPHHVDVAWHSRPLTSKPGEFSIQVPKQDVSLSDTLCSSKLAAEVMLEMAEDKNDKKCLSQSHLLER